MWHWEVVWVGKDGETYLLTSEHGWNTQQEAYTVVTSISEFIVQKLRDLGAVGVIDFELVYKHK